MELYLTLFEKMSGLRRAQSATQWTMRSQKAYAGKQDKFTENELK